VLSIAWRRRKRPSNQRHPQPLILSKVVFTSTGIARKNHCESCANSLIRPGGKTLAYGNVQKDVQPGHSDGRERDAPHTESFGKSLGSVIHHLSTGRIRSLLLAAAKLENNIAWTLPGRG